MRQSASVVVVLITVNKQILPDAAEKLIELFVESFVRGERGETTERSLSENVAPGNPGPPTFFLLITPWLARTSWLANFTDYKSNFNFTLLFISQCYANRAANVMLHISCITHFAVYF